MWKPLFLLLKLEEREFIADAIATGREYDRAFLTNHAMWDGKQLTRGYAEWKARTFGPVAGHRRGPVTDDERAMAERTQARVRAARAD